MSHVQHASNRQFLDTLFREHNGWLLRWLRSQQMSVLPPEDVVAEVFLALLVMPNIEAIRQPRAMMTTIARRLIIDARRRDNLRRAYESELSHLPKELELSNEDRMIVVQALRDIDDMLCSLSLNARKAFVMSQVHGKTYREIAEVLGVSLGMARRYVEQGLRAAYAAAARET